MKTLKDIAKLGNVSTMTISRYFSAPDKLSKSTREKIKALVDENDFSPNALAKSLITKKSSLIGVIVPDIRNPYFSLLYYRLENFLEPLGYSLMLCNSKEDAQKEEEYIQLLMSRQVEGILLVPVAKENIDILIKRKRNFVLIERIFESINVNSVSSDHYGGAYMAVEHLIKLGHTNIAVLSGDTQLKPYKDRLEAYFDVLKSHNIPIKEQLVCESKIIIESAEEAIINLINREKDLTAVFSCNNRMSLGAINAIYKSKLTIPGDISFAAFDELPGTDIFLPSITSVFQDTSKLAQTAVDLLMDQISHKNSAPKQVVFPVTLREGI